MSKGRICIGRPFLTLACLSKKSETAATEEEKAELLEEAIAAEEIAIELGGKHYNLGCLLARKGDDIERAFDELELALKSKEITKEFVESDPDWSDLRTHRRYKDLV